MSKSPSDYWDIEPKRRSLIASKRKRWGGRPSLFIDIPKEETDPIVITDKLLLKRDIDYVLSSLPAREAKVLRLWASGLTYYEISKRIGVSIQRTSDIRDTALTRLRHPVIRRLLRDFLN